MGYIRCMGGGGGSFQELNDINTWLKLGGVSGTYSSLSDILADTTALNKLMTTKNSVDYLVGCDDFIIDICANSNGMSAIGTSNYCANSLLAHNNWISGICNSTYFESVLNDKIPIMTSDTTPSGICSASYEGTPAYRAFDGDLTNFWYNYKSGGGTLPAWIQYDFGTNKHIYKCIFYPYFKTHLRVKEYEILSSTDGTNFTQLVIDTLADSQALSINGVAKNINSNASIFRLKINSHYSGTSTDAVGICELQFYSRKDI